MIELADKKRFVGWLIDNVSFKKKEAYWILSYLKNHDAILNHVTFVQGALSAPRGILMTDKSVEGFGLEMSQKKTVIREADEIFCDIRRNRKETLYIEIIFEHMTTNDFYLTVLEENQYQPIDQALQDEFEEMFALFCKEQELFFLREQLRKRIDLALEIEDEEQFNDLSKEYYSLIKEEKKIT